MRRVNRGWFSIPALLAGAVLAHAILQVLGKGLTPGFLILLSFIMSLFGIIFTLACMVRLAGKESSRLLLPVFSGGFSSMATFLTMLRVRARDPEDAGGLLFLTVMLLIPVVTTALATARTIEVTDPVDDEEEEEEEEEAEPEVSSSAEPQS